MSPSYGKRTAPSSKSHRHTEPIKQAPSEKSDDETVVEKSKEDA